MRKYNKPYFQQYYREHTAVMKANARRQRKKMRRIVVEFKRRPCMDCGVQYAPWIMQCDHVRGQKVGDITTMMNARGVQHLLAELEKCEVVCANCHAERTHRRQVG